MSSLNKMRGSNIGKTFHSNTAIAGAAINNSFANTRGPIVKNNVIGDYDDYEGAPATSHTYIIPTKTDKISTVSDTVSVTDTVNALPDIRVTDSIGSITDSSLTSSVYNKITPGTALLPLK